MNDKLIADYVRERYPEMLTTLDFAFYHIGHGLRTMADSFVAGFRAGFNKEDEDNGTCDDIDLHSDGDNE